MSQQSVSRLALIVLCCAKAALAADAMRARLQDRHLCAQVQRMPQAFRLKVAAAAHMGSSRKCTTPLSLPATTVMGLPEVPANPQQVSPVSAMKKPSTAPARVQYSFRNRCMGAPHLLALYMMAQSILKELAPMLLSASTLFKHRSRSKQRRHNRTAE